MLNHIKHNLWCQTEISWRVADWDCLDPGTLDLHCHQVAFIPKLTAAEAVSWIPVMKNLTCLQLYRRVTFRFYYKVCFCI